MEPTETPAKPGRKPRQRRMARPAEAAAPLETVAPPPARQTRLAVLTAMLARPEGATLADMQQASGWQAHSVRGFLAGTLKKKGYTVTSQPADGGRIYRAVLAGGAAGA